MIFLQSLLGPTLCTGEKDKNDVGVFIRIALLFYYTTRLIHKPLLYFIIVSNVGMLPNVGALTSGVKNALTHPLTRIKGICRPKYITVIQSG